MKTLNVIKKNLKLLFKSKFTLFIVILGPLLILLTVGGFFESKSDLRVDIGYYSAVDDSNIDSLASMLNQENYSIDQYSSIESCLNELKIGREQLCIEFPGRIDFEKGSNNEIIFHADNSKLNLYGPVIEKIDSRFRERALQISGNYTSDILGRLDYISQTTQKTIPVLNRLDKKITNLTNKLSLLSEDIKSLDISTESEELSTEDLGDNIEDMGEEVEGLKNAGNDAINEINSLNDFVDSRVDDISDSLEDHNDTCGECDEIESELDDSESRAETIDEDLEGAYSELADLFKELQAFKDDVESLNEDIQKDSENIKEMQDKKENLVQQMQAQLKKLNSSRSQISTAKEKLNAISNHISSTPLKDTEMIVSPFDTKTVPLNVEDDNVLFIFPYVIILIIMFMGLLLSSVLIMDEKKSNAIFRNFVTPTNDLVFIIGNYLTLFLIVFLQVSVVVGLFYWYFQADVITNIATTLLILAGAITLFIMLGMAIAYMMNNEQTSTLSAVLIGTILLFLSNLITPLEMLPAKTAYYIKLLNPFVMSSELLRKSMIYHFPIVSFQKEISLLLMFALLLFCIMFLVMFMQKQQLKFFGKKKPKQEKVDEASMANIYNNLGLKNGYVTNDGKVYTSFDEMINDMKNTPPKEFQKNFDGISDWVESTLKNPKLAKRIKKCKNKKDMIDELTKAKSYYESLGKKI